ncbi:MAG: hypothetical protein WBD20_22990 [Pirellulaceae bacterium]
MSSNRHNTPCDAYLRRDDHSVGPLRLPEKNVASFVEEFNRIYGKLGMKLQTVSVPVSEEE